MSATLQIDHFRSYFSCPVIELSGRAFPVNIYHSDEVLQMQRRAQLQQHESRMTSIPAPIFHSGTRSGKGKEQEKGKGKGQAGGGKKAMYSPEQKRGGSYGDSSRSGAASVCSFSS